MPRLELSLLGTFQATLGGKPIRVFRSAKVRALLAYLAIEADKPHQREALAGLFWPEEPEDIARQNLRQSLYQLRKTLSPENTPDRQAVPFLLITRQTVQFNPQSDHQLDVAQFLGAVKSGQLERAVRLYRGDLLRGLFVRESVPFEEWLTVSREQLHRLALDALYQLTQHYQAQGDYRTTQAYAQQQLALEPWREEAHRQLMLVLALSGHRSAALAQYDICRRSLADELEVEPEAETTALYERIRDGAMEQVRIADGRLRIEEASDKSALRTPHSALTRAPAPVRHIVGREHERAELHRAFQSANRGHGLLVCVSGESGIGKTTFVEDVIAELMMDGQPCMIARGSCSERLVGAEAYLPWLEALDKLAAGPGP